MKSLPLVVFLFIMATAFCSSVCSYHSAERIIDEDVNKALELTLAKMPCDVVSADPFSDVTCQSCSLLPFCGGGCPHSRIMNDFYGSSNNNCHFAKWHIKEFLETSYYLQNILKFYGRN